MTETALRKSALAASLLDARARRRLYASLPASMRLALKIRVGEVEAKGWAQRSIIDAALGEAFVQPVERGMIGLDELLRLAARLDPAIYARVLQASELRNPEFLLSLLEVDYAESVRAGLAASTALPPALRIATLQAAIAALSASIETEAA
jgi:hypothetical protein